MFVREELNNNFHTVTRWNSYKFSFATKLISNHAIAHPASPPTAAPIRPAYKNVP